MSQHKIIDIDGARFWTTVSGTGPAMVLCHGGPGNFDTLGPVAKMVNDIVTVFRYDQRASGRSTGEPPFTVDRFVEDLEELRYQWGQDTLIVGGHSWGANLALAYCLKYPDRAKALVYISGPGITWDWLDEYKANQKSRLTVAQQTRLDELIQLRKQTPTADQTSISEELLTLLYTSDLADNQNVDLLDRNGFFQYSINWNLNSVINADWISLSKNGKLDSQTASLKIPALVVHGEADPRRLRIAEKMSKLLIGSKLVTLPGVGHLPWLEKPHLLQNSLRSFLKALI